MTPSRRFHSHGPGSALLGTGLVFVAAVSPALAQCAMCSGAAGSNTDAGAAYNTSSLFMLAVPYLLLMGVGGYVFYAFRRSSSPRTPDGSGAAEGDPRPEA